MVSTFDAEVKAEWTTCKPHCDHCNGNHGQLVTFIVRHEDSSEKQVGRTCLKDYCGIDPLSIGRANELSVILLGEVDESYELHSCPPPSAWWTEDALALAIQIKRERGYRSSSEYGGNKEVLTAMMRDHITPREDDKEKAKEIKEFVLEMSDDDARDSMLSNVKAMLKSGYCKSWHMGYVAYAPLAYERWLKKLEERAKREDARDAQRASSDYIGEIGQRLEIEVAQATLVTSWESTWGWTYLYKFVDTKGNVLVWYASRGFDEDGAKKIKATIKDHSEYDGVKQTIITRCSVVA